MKIVYNMEEYNIDYTVYMLYNSLIFKIFLNSRISNTEKQYWFDHLWKNSIEQIESLNNIMQNDLITLFKK